VIHRQSQFQTGVLRQAPSGLDRLTAGAARGGLVRVEPGGLAWQPLGLRLTERVRRLLSLPLSFQTPGHPGDATFPEGALPKVVSAEDEGPRSARSLKDALCLGALEWVVAAPEQSLAVAALEDLERRLTAALSTCALEPVRIECGPDRTLLVLMTPEGSTSFLRCADCGYSAQADMAEFGSPARSSTLIEPMHEVHTPGATTIKKLCAQLSIPPSDTMKALFLTASGGHTFLALLRGDLDASPSKLCRALGTAEVRPASGEEVASLGVVPGFAGPVALDVRPGRNEPGIWVVGDASIVGAANLVTGANREDYHLAGVNYPRDFTVTEIVDFARAPAGAPCARCTRGVLHEEPGFIVASRVIPREAAQTSFDGERPESAGPTLRAYPGAAVAAIVSAAMWENGMRFPPACSPFFVHLIQLPGGLDLTAVIDDLDRSGVEALFDDRDVSAGVKFAEADWIGAPVRIVSGRKSAEAGGVEVVSQEGGKRIVPIEGLVSSVLEETRSYVSNS
jgi:hypothetical protein